MIIHPLDPREGRHGNNVVAPVAAGLNYSYTPPNYVWCEMLNLHIQLTTDATVANRRLAAYLDPVANPQFNITLPALQSASLTYDYYFGRGMCFVSTTMSLLNFTTGWPDRLLFQAPFGIHTLIDGLQAGDQITLARLHYVHWQDPVLL